MTAQISDTVLYADATWMLAGVNGDELFTPESRGLAVRMASTACWRGFVCRYALRDNELLLDELEVAAKGDAPRMFDRDPEEPTMGRFGFTTSYRSIGERVPFTGGLLLGRNFFEELYVHMGFHPAWKYADVVEVELDAGHVVRVRDCSKAMAEIRARLAGRDGLAPESTKAEIEAWVDRAFSRRY